MAFDPTTGTTNSASNPSNTGRAQTWQQGQNAFNTGYAALGKQQQLAGQTGDLWAGIAKANEAQNQQGQQAIQRGAAANLYANRGSLGGGGGLAALQNAGAASALAQGQYGAGVNQQRAQTAEQGQQAQIGAQGTIASAAGNQYKMLQDQQQRQARINASLDSARSIMQRYAGSVFTTGADRQKAINAINTEVLGTETDPAVIAGVQQYIAGLQHGSQNPENTINL